MMRQTGGFAVGEISTRSRPFCLAIASACGGGMMPSCWPSSSITRISLTRMRSLTRTRSSRRGVLSKAIRPSLNLCARGPTPGCSSFRRDLVVGRADKRVDLRRPFIPAGPLANRDGARLLLTVADDQHVRHLLELGLPDLISNLFLARVEMHPEARGLKSGPHRFGVIHMPVGD